MQLRSALLAATVLATPIAASAQPVTGLYVGFGAGVNIMQKEDIRGAGISIPGIGTVSTSSTVGSYNGSTGFVGVFSVGWGFGNGLRAEVEANYRGNHNNGLSGTFFTGTNGSTFEQKYGGMVNVLYDFNGLTPWLVPYLGVGVGYVAVNEQWKVYNTGTTTVAGAGTFGPGSANVNGQSTKGAFAYQGIIGAAVPLTSIVPGLAFTTEYRYFGTTGDRTYGGTATAVNTAGTTFTAPAGIKLGASHNHSILLGLRYNFGVAPPPPPPAAAAAPVKPAMSYLVFFDWDKATLTDRARQIIREAADNSTKVQYTRIEVNGYTDTSGTKQYNQGLSVRRAQAVAAELVKDGVPRNAISIQGFGDTKLLVPTGPGVREPQNRRVEIIIR
jgi:outer membrane protein OmpA-like peptidoglycan-associated protein